MLHLGSTVDRYLVEEKLGEGGMASVYRVKHMALGTRYALKVLTLQGESLKDRMVLEGRAQAVLDHPNVVSVTDVLEVGGAPGLVMEFIRGPSLDQWLTAYRPTLDEALAIFRGIVAGVNEAHVAGMTHRDLKPANIMLHLDEELGAVPKVADFGLVKVSGSASTTRTGTAMGTPAYMAPEQIRDASAVDRRADIYSLGVLLYQLVTGTVPFAGDDLLDLFTRVAKGDYEPANQVNRWIPEPVSDAIDLMMERRPERRPNDCAAVLEVLDGAQGTEVAALASASLEPPRPLPQGRPDVLLSSSPGFAIATRFVKPMVSIEPISKPTASGAARWPWVLGAAVAFVLISVLMFSTSGLTLLATLLFRTPSPVSTVAEVTAPAVPPLPSPTSRPALEPAAPPAAPMPAAAEPAAPVPTISKVEQPAPKKPVPPQPAVRPAPAPRPVRPAPVVAEAPAPSVPAPATGRFRVQDAGGALSIVLRGPQRSYGPGDPVPEGSYQIIARFPELPPNQAGVANVPAGGSVSIVCNQLQQMCAAR